MTPNERRVESFSSTPTRLLGEICIRMIEYSCSPGRSERWDWSRGGVVSMPRACVPSPTLRKRARRRVGSHALPDHLYYIPAPSVSHTHIFHYTPPVLTRPLYYLSWHASVQPSLISPAESLEVPCASLAGLILLAKVPNLLSLEHPISLPFCCTGRVTRSSRSSPV